MLFRVRDLIVKPALLQRFDIQKLQSTAVYLYRAGADVMVVEQIEEILANLLGAELGRRGVEMLGVALDGVDIGVNGCFREVAQLQLLDHLLA